MFTLDILCKVELSAACESSAPDALLKTSLSNLSCTFPGVVEHRTVLQHEIPLQQSIDL